MKDRVPKYPGRVYVTPENGGAPYYATVERADEPVVEGTALNKANLLSDTTATMLGFTADEDPTVNDALYRVNKNIDNYQSTFQKLMTGRFI